MPAPPLPRQFARTRGFRLGEPGAFSIGADGGTVLFLRTRGGEDPVSCLWALDVRTGAERLLADPLRLLAGAAGALPDEAIRRERAREKQTGIAGYATDAAGQAAAFALSGELWIADAGSGRVRRLPAAGPVADPRPDPAGRRIAYLTGGALRVIEADGTRDRAVAEPDGPEVSFGGAEHVAAESMGRTRGYWWSPDGERLLAARVDQAPVARWHIASPDDPAARPRTVRYPAAGTANAEVTLWLATVDGSRAPVSWDREALEYLTAGGWDAHGPYAAVQSRDQGTVVLLGIDPAGGGTAVLAEQRDSAWVQLVPGLPARTASGAVISHRDTPGTRFLTVGREPVTPPGLNLQRVLAVDGDDILFTASADPLSEGLWVCPAGAAPRELSDGPGVHTGLLRAGTLVHTARTPGRAGSRTTVTRAGSPAAVVESLAAQPVLTLRRTLHRTGPQELRSALFLPSGHPAGAPLPVLLDPYAGPAAQKVTAGQMAFSFVSQWFAEQGFAVLVTDGRGTPGRGPGWERAVHGDIFGPALADQVAALHAVAADHPELDLSRVAIRGWSYGGALSAAAVLRRPDVFHAAVAGAPVTDQRLYDTHWRERFLGHPSRYPDRYDACDLVREAPRLTRPLLLIHGLADGNVFAAHSLRLSAALLAAGRPHEVLPLSGATHQISSEIVAENLLLHQLDFLRRSLGLRQIRDAQP